MKKEIQLPTTMTIQVCNPNQSFSLIDRLQKNPINPVYRISSSITREEISIDTGSILDIKLEQGGTLSNISWEEIEVGKIYYQASEESEKDTPGSLLKCLVIYKDELYMVVILIGAVIYLKPDHLENIKHLVTLLKPEVIFTQEDGYNSRFIDTLISDEVIQASVDEQVVIYERGKNDEIINDYVGEIYMFNVEENHV